MYASLPKIQSSFTNYSPYTNFRNEKSTTFHWSCPSKTSHASFTYTWLKHTWIHLAQIKTWKQKAQWRANLICFHNSYALILTPGIMQAPKFSFPGQKTRLDKYISPCLKQ